MDSLVFAALEQKENVIYEQFSDGKMYAVDALFEWTSQFFRDSLFIPYFPGSQMEMIPHDLYLMGMDEGMDDVRFQPPLALRRLASLRSFFSAQLNSQLVECNLHRLLVREPLCYNNATNLYCSLFGNCVIRCVFKKCKNFFDDQMRTDMTEYRRLKHVYNDAARKARVKEKVQVAKKEKEEKKGEEKERRAFMAWRDLLQQMKRMEQWILI